MQKIEAMLASLADTPPKGDDWLFEIKYDGYRILAVITDKRAQLLTRNGNDYTDKFASIAKALQAFVKDRSFILDGEVVVTDNAGRTDFSALQGSIRGKKDNAIYIVFDILSLDGKDLRQLPLITRKEHLSEILANCPDNITESAFVIGKGEESFAAARQLNLEGIIAKKINSVYSGSRNGDWLKIKSYKRQEFVIGGYTTSDKNSTLAAVLLGYYNAGKLIYIGKAGTGFSEKDKTELNQAFAEIKCDKPYFDKIPKEKNIVFLKPSLMAEIQFAEITADGLLRQSSFKGLRSDKDPEDVVLEYV